MKCGPNLKKYMQKNGMDEGEMNLEKHAETLSDEYEANGAEKAVDKDPIKGKKHQFKKGGK